EALTGGQTTGVDDVTDGDLISSHDTPGRGPAVAAGAADPFTRAQLELERPVGVGARVPAEYLRPLLAVPQLDVIRSVRPDEVAERDRPSTGLRAGIHPGPAAQAPD